MGAQRATSQPLADRTAVMIALEFMSGLRPEPWFLNDGGTGSANSAPRGVNCLHVRSPWSKRELVSM